MNWKGIYGGWIKNYVDGTSYIGNDPEVRSRRASWINSRNDDIISVGIKFGGKICEIYGFGEYWQSDSFCVNFPYSDVKMTNRRIQRRISNKDRFIKFVNTYSIFGIKYIGATLCNSVGSNQSEGIVIINESDIGKWLTLEIDINSNSVRHYISNVRI